MTYGQQISEVEKKDQLRNRNIAQQSIYTVNVYVLKFAESEGFLED